MLSTEGFINDYYQEQVSNWRCTKNLELGNIVSEISYELLKTLNNKCSYQITDLAQIWREAPEEDISQNEQGGINKLTRFLYDMDTSFESLYNKLSKIIISKFPGEMVIQRTPTIRVHASSSKDSFYPFWHSDLLLGHPLGEINIWIPFTEPNMEEDHGFNICEPVVSYDFYKNNKGITAPYELLSKKEIIKSSELIKHSTPVQTKLGEAIVFDSRCFHSAIPIYNHSRVSMDVRIIDKKYLREPYPKFQGLGRRKAIFDSENFFKELDYSE